MLGVVAGCARGCARAVSGDDGAYLRSGPGLWLRHRRVGGLDQSTRRYSLRSGCLVEPSVKAGEGVGTAADWEAGWDVGERVSVW